MQRECDEYYEDSQVFLDDVIKFKYIVKTLDVGQLTQRKYCEEVDKIYS